LALLYGAQVTLGYFLMLAAMTYQVGLGVAEFFFSKARSLPTSLDPGHAFQKLCRHLLGPLSAA
jgi:hypothetical protein